MDPKEGDYVRFKHKRVEITGIVIKRSGIRIRVQPGDGGATLWKELSELLPLASAVDEASEVAQLQRLFSLGPSSARAHALSSARVNALSAFGVQAAANPTVAGTPNKFGMPTSKPELVLGPLQAAPPEIKREVFEAAPSPHRPAIGPERPDAFRDDGDDTNLDDIDDDDAERPTVGAQLAVVPIPVPIGAMNLPSEIIRVLSGLDDGLAEALHASDIKLLRVSWLRRLRRRLRQPDWRSLRRRQELEALKAESPFLSADEAVALLRRGTRGVGALTHGWLSPGECDPDGARLDMVLAALDEHPHIEGLFWDYASLFQNLPHRERTPDERAAFGRAIKVMADVYASAVGTTVLQSREIPPRPKSFDGALCLFGLKPTMGEAAVRETLGCFGAIVALELTRNPPVVRFASHEMALDAKRAGPWAELCDGVDTLYNERPYDERGWCVFENAVSYELLARLPGLPRVREALDALPSKVLVLRSGQPTEPGVAREQRETRVAKVVASIERASFTGKGDKAMVVALYRKYVARIIGVVQSVILLGTGTGTGHCYNPHLYNPHFC
jgi:hypothetical protein